MAEFVQLFLADLGIQTKFSPSRKVLSYSWHFTVSPLEGALKFTARETGLENRGTSAPKSVRALTGTMTSQYVLLIMNN